MQNTKSESNQLSPRLEEESDDNLQSSDSEPLPPSSDALGTSKNISKNLCEELMKLIRDVNKKEVTPASVTAACKAGDVIHKVLRLNYEMKANGY